MSRDRIIDAIEEDPDLADFPKLDENAQENEADSTPRDRESPNISGILEHPTYQALEEKLLDAEKRADLQWDQATRALAELDNVRKRSAREVENAHKYGIEQFAKALLPILDSLEQALSSVKLDASGPDSAMQGIELTLKLFQDTLKKFSIEVIEPQDLPFDPQWHEAMSIQETAGVPPGTVVMVLQKGYRLNDRLLRPARVMVSKSSLENGNA